MSERKRTNNSARSSASKRGSAPAKRSAPPAKRRKTVPAKSGPSFSFFKPRQADFKPDQEGTDWLKLLHMTRQQRLTYLKWGLYIATIVLLLVIQDVIMAKVSIFGGTTDLAVCAILLITVIEGTEVGSLFVIIASTLYYFSGSSTGPACVALLTIFGVGACMFRQMYWHRSRGSIVLCAGLALMAYELGSYAVALFQGLTRWDRLGAFLATGILSFLVMIPLYSLINVIGQIGGNTWKE